MRQININTRKNTYHVCDVLCVRKNIINGCFTIYFFDHVDNGYCYANLIKENDNYYIDKIKFSENEVLFKRIIDGIKRKMDISFLPPYLNSIHHKNITNNDILIDNSANHAFSYKKIDYLELVSYSDAINLPLYYYFRIIKMEPTVEGFDYTLKLSEVSKKPLKKNIISRHITNKSLDEITKIDDNYFYTTEDEELVKKNFNAERILVKKLIELIGGKRKIDTVLLTKVATLMFQEEDKQKAAREYQVYLNTYYDKWLKDKEYSR